MGYYKRSLKDEQTPIKVVITRKQTFSNLEHTEPPKEQPTEEDIDNGCYSWQTRKDIN